ncbi:hypothetical protein [Microvirga sp. CF3016]|uniref:hypothetical protein n=1 Tax=Microvirga sp. CF3016 TaxID=3110181 RepID=UPI002E7720F6|nr:hypothetical protein [Microvirga sp. CF3016]MEE1610360.1 hypothetical protein [Microvirga sp. CF3016]
MSLALQPVCVANGWDEEVVLVFDKAHRVLAVLTHPSEQNEVAHGQWYLEAGFGPVDGIERPTFADLEDAQDWLSRRLGHWNPSRA